MLVEKQTPLSQKKERKTCLGTDMFVKSAVKEVRLLNFTTCLNTK